MAKTNVNTGSGPNEGDGDPLRTAFTSINSNTDEIYNLFGNGSTLAITGDATVSAGALTIANDAVEQAMIADDAVGADQLASNAVVTASITDDNVTHDKLEGRYTKKQPDITDTTGTISLDASSYAIFELTGNLGTVQLDINNMKKGQVIDILLTGSDLSSAVITLADNFSTSQINKVGSTDLDTSKTNVIQVVCVDDTDSAAILLYSINTYTADTTP